MSSGSLAVLKGLVIEDTKYPSVLPPGKGIRGQKKDWVSEEIVVDVGFHSPAAIAVTLMVTWLPLQVVI